METVATPYGFALNEHDEGGDGLYAILLRELGIAVNIYFQNIGFIANSLFHLIKDWGLHFARSAPSGVEVNQCGFLISDDV